MDSFRSKLGEVPSPFFNLISNANGDQVVVSGANTIAIMHDVECASSKDIMHGSIILVSESICRCSDVKQGLDKRCSVKNILSLVNWKEYLDESYEACSLVFQHWKALSMKHFLLS